METSVEIIDDAFHIDTQLHQHCLKCFLQNCTDLFAKTCKVVSCENNCGAIMHVCKMEDHLTICLNAIQPCTNFSYGCPYKFRRKNINQHLQICPASVVVCTMEWNRKPLDLQSTHRMTGYNPNSPIFNCFDVGTALTDQRVLLEALIPSDFLDQISKHSENKVKEVLPFKSVNLCSSEKLNKESGIDFISNQNSLGVCTSKSNNEGSDYTHSTTIAGSVESAEVEIPKFQKPLLRTKFQLTPKKVFRDVCCDTSDLEIDSSSMEWMNPGVKILGFDFLTCIFEMLGAYEKRESVSNSYSSEGLRCTLYDARLCSYRHVATQSRPFYDNHKHCGKVGGAVQQIFDESNEQYILSKNHSKIKMLYENLVLNQVMECLPRYEKKNRSLYTFMCNNFLRRDQFQAHFQNVHCEICSNLYGWLEEKCPYAQYGCHFAQFRFVPNSLSDALLYDSNRSCFAVHSKTIENEKNHSLASSEISYLLSLPWEVLEHILRFLDSYSLGQLSQTCIALQNVCVSFLKQRGIVTLKWEKFRRIDGQITWQNTDETWIFTNSFTHIRKWVFNDVPSMSHHVKSCPVAAKYTTTYPYNTRIKLTPGKKKES